MGWSLLQICLRACDNDPHRISALKLASMCYLFAAAAYPVDDDYHPAFLRKHLECLCLLDEPLNVTLPLCQQILKAVPEALEIWGAGPTGDQLRECQEQVRAFETHWRREVAEGRATLEDIGKIDMPTVPKMRTEEDGAPFTVTYADDGSDNGEGPSGTK